METARTNDQPLFSAVAGSARQLFQLLRCLNFVSKGNIQISREGLHFTVEESQVMQGQTSRHTDISSGD